MRSKEAGILCKARNAVGLQLELLGDCFIEVNRRFLAAWEVLLDWSH